jgi:acetate kinase
MRALLASEEPRARLAVDFYAYRAAQEIGKLAVTLGGLDTLVFTAGIGANSPPVRARICAHLTDLFGISLDNAANNDNSQRVSSDASRVPVLVLPTDEEGMIALSTARILRESGKL